MDNFGVKGRSGGGLMWLGLYPDTGKAPTSVFCAHFLYKPGTLSSSDGGCTTPYLDSIDFTA